MKGCVVLIIIFTVLFHLMLSTFVVSLFSLDSGDIYLIPDSSHRLNNDVAVSMNWFFHVLTTSGGKLKDSFLSQILFVVSKCFFSSAHL